MKKRCLAMLIAILVLGSQTAEAGVTVRAEVLDGETNILFAQETEKPLEETKGTETVDEVPEETEKSSEETKGTETVDEVPEETEKSSEETKGTETVDEVPEETEKSLEETGSTQREEIEESSEGTEETEIESAEVPGASAEASEASAGSKMKLEQDTSLRMSAEEDLGSIQITGAEGTELRGDGNTWLYVGESQQYTLNTEELTLTDYEVVWEIGTWDENGEFHSFDPSVTNPLSYEISGNGAILTLTGQAAGDGIGVHTTVSAADGTEVDAWMNCDVREPYYDYQFGIGDGIAQLPYWDFGIDKYFNCYVENAEHPYGENLQVEITDVTVENAPDETAESDIVACVPWEDGNGWNLHMNTFGHAVGIVTYTLVDGSGGTAEHTFDIWVGGDVYNMSITSSTGTDQMLPGDGIDLTAEVWLECYREEEGHYRGSTENVTLEWSFGDPNYTEAFLAEVDAENSGILHVTAKDDSLGWNLQVQLRAYVPDENEEPTEVCYQNYWLNVCDSYVNLLPVSINTNLAVGEETTVEPELWVYTTENRDGFVTSAVWQWEWDTNALQITDADGKILDEEDSTGTAPFRIKKLKNWYTSANLLAMMKGEDEHYEEYTRRSWDFCDQDYNIWFDNLRGDGYSWIFAAGIGADNGSESENEDYVLALNTEHLEGRSDYEVTWQVGFCDEEGNYTYESAAGDTTYTVNEAGTGITLHAAGLKTELSAQIEDWQEGYSIWFNIRAIVSAGGEEVSRTDAGMEIVEPEYGLADDSEGDVLPGSSFVYENEKISCWVKNKDFPYGEDVWLDLTEITVSGQEPADGEQIFISSREAGSWVLTANAYGEADITYRTTNDTLGEREFIRHKYVCSDIYRLSIYSETGTNCLLPGDFFTLGTEVWHAEYDEENAVRVWEKMESGYTLTWENFNEDILSVEKKDGVLIFTAGEECGNAYVNVILNVLTENEDFYQRYEGMEVCVTDCYYQLFAEDIIAEPGEETEIPAVLKQITTEHPEGIAMSSAEFTLELADGSDSAFLQPATAGNRVAVSADAVGTADDPVEVYLHITARMTDEYGNEICEGTESQVTICAHQYQKSSSESADCMHPGTNTYCCSKCGKEKTETIAATGHSAGGWTVTKAATCTAAGTKVQKCTACGAVVKTETIAATGHSAGAWTVTKAAACTTAGTKVQKCTTCGAVIRTETIAATGHNFGEWKTTTKATALKEGVSTRVCSVCGSKETKKIAKLKATIKLNATSIPLQVKKSTTAVKVISMTDGDAIASWKSSNTKIATVNSKGKITGKKVGTATITVKLKSGVTGKVKVKVQKKAVTTTKITVTGKNTKISKNKLTLKKGKSEILVTSLSPITSTDKVTYSTSDKKIVTVSKSGKVTAKKVGKAKITVKSGKKKVVITVTVKK